MTASTSINTTEPNSIVIKLIKAEDKKGLRQFTSDLSCACREIIGDLLITTNKHNPNLFHRKSSIQSEVNTNTIQLSSEDRDRQFKKDHENLINGIIAHYEKLIPKDII